MSRLSSKMDGISRQFPCLVMLNQDHYSVRALLQEEVGTAEPRPRMLPRQRMPQARVEHGQATLHHKKRKILQLSMALILALIAIPHLQMAMLIMI